MMKYNVRFEQWIPVPLERTFRFFADPSNLPLISPPELALRIEDLSVVPADPVHPNFAAAGSTVTVSFRIPIIGLRMQHVAQITGFEMNRYFRDQHTRWPLMDWDHRHEFDSASQNGSEGTVVHDDLHYALGPGFLGAIPNALIVHRQLKRMFEFRQRALNELVTAGAL